MHTTLISTSDLAAHLADPAYAMVDCRFDLANTGWGEQQYLAAHIPGAVYAHLSRDLSGSKSGSNGRHPLPSMDDFRARLGHWGIASGIQVVAYDQEVGMYASRLWWMLRYLGHQAVAVLDGGMAKWLREARPTQTGAEQRSPRPFEGEAHEEMRVTVDVVQRLLSDPAYVLIDARAPERYRGETEPIDPVAGHIPGAVNLYSLSNVNPDGTHLAPEALREKWSSLLGDVPASRAVTYCGSGVAACHDLLAFEHAGLTGAKVYIGSWSEWCAERGRPVASGSQP